MTRRDMVVVGILCCALAACAAGAREDGTYHLAIALDAQHSSPLDTLTSTVTWPSAAELTLQVTGAHTAQIELFGEREDADATWVMHSVDPDVAPGTLLLTFGSRFRVTIDDTVACPQTNPTSLHGSTALRILDGRVRGQTTDDEICSLDGDLRYARFFFDVTGKRVGE